MIGGANLATTINLHLLRGASGRRVYIATRKGRMVSPVVPWTKKRSIKAEGADGKQSTNLSVQSE